MVLSRVALSRGGAEQMGEAETQAIPLDGETIDVYLDTGGRALGIVETVSPGDGDRYDVFVTCRQADT